MASPAPLERLVHQALNGFDGRYVVLFGHAGDALVLLVAEGNGEFNPAV